MNKKLPLLLIASFALLASCDGGSAPAASSHATGLSTEEDTSRATGLSTEEATSHATGLLTSEEEETSEEVPSDESGGTEVVISEEMLKDIKEAASLFVCSLENNYRINLLGSEIQSILVYEDLIMEDPDSIQTPPEYLEVEDIDKGIFNYFSFEGVGPAEGSEIYFKRFGYDLEDISWAYPFGVALGSINLFSDAVVSSITNANIEEGELTITFSFVMQQQQISVTYSCDAETYTPASVMVNAGVYGYIITIDSIGEIEPFELPDYTYDKKDVKVAIENTLEFLPYPGASTIYDSNITIDLTSGDDEHAYIQAARGKVRVTPDEGNVIELEKCWDEEVGDYYTATVGEVTYSSVDQPQAYGAVYDSVANTFGLFVSLVDSFYGAPELYLDHSRSGFLGSRLDGLETVVYLSIDGSGYLDEMLTVDGKNNESLLIFSAIGTTTFDK